MAAAHREFTPNALVAALPRRDYHNLGSHLELVSLPLNTILYEPGDVVRHVYFPNDCLVSLLTLVDQRKVVEAGMIGHEGMVGTEIAVGIAVSPVRALVQGAGTAMRIEASRFRREFKRSPALQRLVHHNIYSMMTQLAQSAACNRFHSVIPRLARWLLMTQDRLRRDQFHYPQKLMAEMLGVRRTGISLAASTLQKRKLIDYHRGDVTIVDRERLQATACACYQTVKTRTQRNARQNH